MNLLRGRGRLREDDGRADGGGRHLDNGTMGEVGSVMVTAIGTTAIFPIAANRCTLISRNNETFLIYLETSRAEMTLMQLGQRLCWSSVWSLMGKDQMTALSHQKEERGLKRRRRERRSWGLIYPSNNAFY